MANDEITKIESLTPEQEALFPGHVDKWTEIGLSTEPADRPKAMTAIRGLYRQSDLDQVPIAWVSSPIVGALAASLLAVIVPKIREELKAIDSEFGLTLPGRTKEFYAERQDLDQLADDRFPATVKRTLEEITDDWVACEDPNVTAAVDMITNAILQAEYIPRLNRIAEEKGFEVANAVSVRSMLKFSAINRDAILKEQLEWHAWYGGQFWCAFAAWATFFRDVIKVPVPQIEHEANLCESAGYIWPNEDYCLVCERPRRLTVVQDRLDDGEGPAMEYPDGWQLWFLGGVRVNKKIVMEPEKLTVDEIKKEQNEEVRRIMINRWGGRDSKTREISNVVGWKKYIKELGATELDSRENEVEGTSELLLKTPDNLVLFVSFCPSTGRQYILEVNRDIATCKTAQDNLTQGNSLTQGGQRLNIVGRS